MTPTRLLWMSRRYLASDIAALAREMPSCLFQQVISKFVNGEWLSAVCSARSTLFYALS